GFPSFVVLFGVTVCLGGIALTLTRRPGEVRLPGLVAWLAYPLAAGSLLFLFLGSQSPANPLFRLRFHLSRPSVDGLARAALARTQTRDPPRSGRPKRSRGPLGGLGSHRYAVF